MKSKQHNNLSVFTHAGHCFGATFSSSMSSTNLLDKIIHNNKKTGSRLYAHERELMDTIGIDNGSVSAKTGLALCKPKTG